MLRFYCLVFLSTWSLSVDLDFHIETPKVVEVGFQYINIAFYTWNPADGGDGPVREYVIQFKILQDDNSDWEDAIIVDEPRYDFLKIVHTDGLMEGTTYVFRVVPIRDNGWRGVPSESTKAATTRSKDASPTTPTDNEKMSNDDADKDNKGLIMGLSMGLGIPGVTGAVFLAILILRSCFTPASGNPSGTGHNIKCCICCNRDSQDADQSSPYTGTATPSLPNPLLQVQGFTGPRISQPPPYAPFDDGLKEITTFSH